VGLLGVILLACGAAAFIQSRLDLPGGGPMLMGAALLATVAIILLIRRGGRPK